MYLLFVIRAKVTILKRRQFSDIIVVWVDVDDDTTFVDT